MFAKSLQLAARGLLRVAPRPLCPPRPYSLYEPDYLDVSRDARTSDTTTVCNHN